MAFGGIKNKIMRSICVWRDSLRGRKKTAVCPANDLTYPPKKYCSILQYFLSKPQVLTNAVRRGFRMRRIRGRLQTGLVFRARLKASAILFSIASPSVIYRKQPSTDFVRFR